MPGISGSIGNGILGEYFPEREYNLLNPKRTRKRPKFQPCSHLLTRLLLDTDWDQILSNDVHIATEKFIAAILLAAKASIPQKKVRTKNYQKPWLTKELVKNIRKRDRLFRRARKTQSSYDWDRWKYQRNIVTAINKQLKQQHI